MRPVSYRVLGNDRETHDSVTLTMAPVEESLPNGLPGQFNMLWAWGLGEAPISFSRVTASDEVVHTIRDVGSVTHALCGLQPGDVLGARGPFGVGWPVDAARGKDVILVAGGIGLAPLRPVIHEVLADRESFGTVTLVVGARKVHELAFRSELDGWWTDRQIKVRTIVDEPCSHWDGSVGIVTHELRRVKVQREETVAMVCGPEVMMRFVGAALADSGVRPDRIAVSMERNMQCGIGQCGHCQLTGRFMCTDGPVLGWDIARPLMEVREL